jgi:hypothetical protein
LAIAIPISELILTKCDFFLDTIFLGFYTFVNCKVSLAGSMSTRQRENRNNGNQESSSKEASEEGSQENSKKEVSRQRNRQHNRGTPKASPDVFLAEPISSVFMRLRRTLHPIRKFSGGARVENRWGWTSSMKPMRSEFFRDCFFGFVCRPARRIARYSSGDLVRARGREGVPGFAGGGKQAHLLPKWYWAMTPLDGMAER